MRQTDVRLTRRAMAAAIAVPLALTTQAGAQVFSPTGPDAAAYGAEAGYLPGTRGARPAQSTLVGYHSRIDSLYPHNTARAGPAASVLHRAATPLELRYTFQGQPRTIADYLERHPTTGLLIARGDTILLEHYRYARTDRDRLLSQSMAKTVTGMLIGIALRDGAIRSIDDQAAAYVPGLAGSAYGQSTIRDLLHMASGVRYVETYDGTDDHARLGIGLFGPNSPGAARVLSQFNTREAEPGTRFHYASAESEVLGLVVMGATGMKLSAYLETRLWQPMGAEADATWITDARGQEVGYCCFSAVLRDWARFGLMLAHDGAWNGRQIVPSEWMQDATTVAAPFLGAVRPGTGYGYQTWLIPGPRRQFVLLGIHGQALYVDPTARLVMVHTAVRARPTGNPEGLELGALWRAVVAAQ